MNVTKKKLPIGIQTFSEIVEHGTYYYVDKTQKIIEMIDESKYIFLSRPRRFGKSLTLDTIAELFSAHQTLFKGLYAEQHWNWNIKYPIIRFNFAKGVDKTLHDFKNSLMTQIRINAEHLQVTLSENISATWLFDDLINKTVSKYKTKVVILIDEYDKPILDNLEQHDIALQMRDSLRDFYSVIKGQDANIRFAMLTGVSKFSKINLFSGLNNLLDITLHDKYSSLCGYTQRELEQVFAPELYNVDLAEVKRWYNGYNWTGESVYNPFDVLLFLNHHQRLYQAYWCETGNPTFLIDKLVKEQVDIRKITQQATNYLLLSKFDVGDISPIALMFQTGYLTIDKVIPQLGSIGYTLKFPNVEVQQSVHSLLLNRYLPSPIAVLETRSMLYNAVLNHDLVHIQQIIKAFFAGIPHDWYRNNKIAHYEGYWASVFYALFASLGFQIIAEDVTNQGNIDLTLIVQHYIYIFEFKVIQQKTEKSTGMALNQIQQKNYADKYRLGGNMIYQIGVEFDIESRNVIFEIESFTQS